MSRRRCPHCDGDLDCEPCHGPSGEPEARHAAELRRLAIAKLAREEHQVDGEVEIDVDYAKVSEAEPNEDNGAYVQAWVWVSFADTPFDLEVPRGKDGDK